MNLPHPPGTPGRAPEPWGAPPWGAPPGNPPPWGPPPARPAAAVVAAVLAFVLAPMVLVGAAYSWLAAGLDSAFRGGDLEGEANLVALMALLCFFPLVAGGVLLLLRVDRWILVTGAVAVGALAVYWFTRGARVLDTGDADWRMLLALAYGLLAVAAAVLALLPAVGRAVAEQRAGRRAARW